VVVFGQGGLEIGCGDMVWAPVVSTPLHEEDQRHQFVFAAFVLAQQQGALLAR